MENGIDVNLLPATFRQALDITRKLGYRFIWIDSLCIIQDSKGDWAREAVLMSDVYGSAECNVAAVGADSFVCCFTKRNPLSLITCALFGGQEDDVFVHAP